jgi:hypothetical protein
MSKENSTLDSDQTPNEEAITALSSYLAKAYVRRDNRFFHVNNPGNPISAEDVRRISLNVFKHDFPEIELSNSLVKAVFERAIGAKHTDSNQSIQVWDGTLQCLPGVENTIVLEDGMASLNRWRKPVYRQHTDVEPDLGAFGRLLERAMPREEDRNVSLDWLSWCLRNEADKPTWALFLYSRRKGTGKSTFCSVASALFGELNSMTQNSVSKLTGKFNLPMLMSKLVISEELHLRPDSVQGNTLKTFISETETTSEAKGRELQRVKQSCCFLFTTNHLPNWIEADDRRYFVIDVDHEGHASGSQAEQFGQLAAEVSAQIKDEAALAGLYAALMARKQGNAFNAKSLNVTSFESPIMARIMGGSRQVVLDQLEELLNERGVFAIGQRDLIAACSDRFKLNANQLRHLIPELGWTSEQVKWGGADYNRVVYVHPDYQIDRGNVVGPNGYRQPIGEKAKPEVLEYVDLEVTF